MTRALFSLLEVFVKDHLFSLPSIEEPVFLNLMSLVAEGLKSLDILFIPISSAPLITAGYLT